VTDKNCIDVVSCAIGGLVPGGSGNGCIDLGSTPPSFSLSCVANCLAEGCANAQKAADQVVNCAVANIFGCFGSGGGGGGVGQCILQKCGSEIAVCLAANCN
jgi:hypothetical protein